jgi:hypothetical protein
MHHIRFFLIDDEVAFSIFWQAGLRLERSGAGVVAEIED